MLDFYRSTEVVARARAGATTNPPRRRPNAFWLIGTSNGAKSYGPASPAKPRIARRSLPSGILLGVGGNEASEAPGVLRKTQQGYSYMVAIFQRCDASKTSSCETPMWRSYRPLMLVLSSQLSG